MRLFQSQVGQAILKPQNQFNDLVMKKAIEQVQKWLSEFEIENYASRLLAIELINQAITDRLKATSISAPGILLSDSAKVESLVFAAKSLADRLDKADRLEALLISAIKADALREGNSF
jgi:methanogenic corrinoid protein MtbC1